MLESHPMSIGVNSSLINVSVVSIIRTLTESHELQEFKMNWPALFSDMGRNRRELLHQDLLSDL